MGGGYGAQVVSFKKVLVGSRRTVSLCFPMLKSCKAIVESLGLIKTPCRLTL